jgi:transcriptional regulator with XRE-family HTH domain
MEVLNVRLSQIIKAYRAENGLSQRQFAAKCNGVSNGYLSMLENECNPSTGKPIIPSIDKLNALAETMGMTLGSLIEMADDMEVDIDVPSPVHLRQQSDILYISTASEDSSADELRRMLHEYIDSLADDELRAMSMVFKIQTT